MFTAQHQINYEILQNSIKLFFRSPYNNLLRIAQRRTLQYDLKFQTDSDTHDAVCTQHTSLSCISTSLYFIRLQCHFRKASVYTQPTSGK